MILLADVVDYSHLRARTSRIIRTPFAYDKPEKSRRRDFTTSSTAAIASGRIL